MSGEEPDGYRRAMYRSLVMFPTSADQRLVDDLVEQMAAAFRERPTFRGMVTSVDALMGPSAERGELRCVVEADFDDLGDLLGALEAEGFREVAEAIEALGPTLLVFECREL
jgi:hypothetical protein